MGAAAGPAASGASIASVGLNMYSDKLKSEGVAASDTFNADRLDRAAEYGELKAQQTGAQLSERLNTTLANIDVIRAAGHDDPNSPTAVAVRGQTEYRGAREIGITTSNIEAQAREQRDSADYLRKASSDALLAGDIAMGSDALKGLSGLAGQMGGGG